MPRNHLTKHTTSMQGETTMMLTKIPHFREVVVCSFECDHCGNRCACCGSNVHAHPWKIIFCHHDEASLGILRRHVWVSDAHIRGTQCFIGVCLSPG